MPRVAAANVPGSAVGLAPRRCSASCSKQRMLPHNRSERLYPRRLPPQKSRASLREAGQAPSLAGGEAVGSPCRIEEPAFPAGGRSGTPRACTLELEPAPTAASPGPASCAPRSTRSGRKARRGVRSGLDAAGQQGAPGAHRPGMGRGARRAAPGLQARIRRLMGPSRNRAALRAHRGGSGEHLPGAEGRPGASASSPASTARTTPGGGRAQYLQAVLGARARSSTSPAATRRWARAPWRASGGRAFRCPKASRVQLWLKPKLADDDDAWKGYRRPAPRRLRALACAFDNEPTHVNAYKRSFPDAYVVHLDTDHSRRPVPVLDSIPSVHDFVMEPRSEEARARPRGCRFLGSNATRICRSRRSPRRPRHRARRDRAAVRLGEQVFRTGRLSLRPSRAPRWRWSVSRSWRSARERKRCARWRPPRCARRRTARRWSHGEESRRFRPRGHQRRRRGAPDLPRRARARRVGPQPDHRHRRRLDRDYQRPRRGARAGLSACSSARCG